MRSEAETTTEVSRALMLGSFYFVTRLNLM